MLNLRRSIRSFIALILAMGLIVSGVHAEMIVTYSHHYAVDLDQKQILLASIREDGYATECALRAYFDKLNSIGKEQADRFDYDAAAIARMLPQSDRIRLAFLGACGTLSPRTEDKFLFRKKTESTN